MSRIHTSGFEFQDNPTADTGSTDGYSAGTVATVTDTTNQRSGRACCKCPGTSASTSFRRLALSGSTPTFVRMYFMVDALPNATKRILVLRASTPANIVSVRLTSAGNLQLWDDFTSAQVGSDSAEAVETGRYYRVEVYLQTASVTATELRVANDQTPPPDYPAVSVASGTSLSFPGGNAFDMLAGWVDAPGVTSNMYLDDFAANNGSSPKQNTWLGEGRVVLFRPATHVASASDRATCNTVTPTDAQVIAAVSTFPAAGHSDALNAAHSPHHLKSSSNVNPTTVLEANCYTYAGGGIPGPVYLTADTATTGVGRIGAATTSTSLVNGAKVAQSFKATGTLDYMEAYLRKDGAPTDDLTFELQSDSAGAPSGTVLGSATVLAADVSGGWVRVFIGGQLLVPETPYWLVASRAGSASDTDVICWQPQTGTAYPDGSPSVHNGTSWVAATGADRAFRVNVTDAATVRVVIPVVCHAEGAGSGTKSGGLSLTANPVSTITPFTYGGDRGAAGTYPTNWGWTIGDPTDEPVLSSFGVAPRLKVTKTDGTTRAAMICALGLIVDYTVPDSSGWQQWTKTSDSSLWWAKPVSNTTVFQWGSMGVNETTVLAGQYALMADPLPAEEADMTEVTAVDRATLEANYTKV